MPNFAPPLKPVKRVGTWAVVGDSTNNFTAENTGTGIIQGGTEAPFWHFNSLLPDNLAGTMRCTLMTAISGVDTQHLVTTQLPLLVAAANTFNFVHLTISLNDCYNSDYNTTNSWESMAANVSTFLTECSKMDKVVMISNASPRAPAPYNNGATVLGTTTIGNNSYSAGGRTKQIAYLAWFRNIAPSIHPDHIFIDSYAIGDDGTNNLLAGYSYDGLHQNGLYAYYWGQRCASSRIRNLVAPALQIKVSSNKHYWAAASVPSSVRTISTYSPNPIVSGGTTLPAWCTETKTGTFGTVTYASELYAADNEITRMAITIPFTSAGTYEIIFTDTFTANARTSSVDNFYGSAFVSLSGATGFVTNIYTRANLGGGGNQFQFGNYTRLADAGGVTIPMPLVDYPIVTPDLNSNSQNLSATYAVLKVGVVMSAAGTVVLKVLMPTFWKLLNPANQVSYASQVINTRVVTAAGAVTVGVSDYVVEVNKTVGAATTVNLPANPYAGKTYKIKDGKGDASTNNITITPAAGNIDGSGTYVMNVAYQSVEITYDGTKWVVL